MAQRGDLRRHQRTPTPHSAPIYLTWKDRSGADRFTRGKVVDLSENGIRVETEHAVEKQAYVVLHAEKIGLHGSASVRSCTRRGAGYVIGLEFSGGMTWKPKTGA